VSPTAPASGPTSSPTSSPSFELLPGAADSPVILHVPHSAREIPADVRADLLLDDPALERELDHITDSHTARIAAESARACAVPPWRFVNRLSRLVVDPERFPDEREEMLAVGMGAVYTRTTHHADLRPADHDPEPLIDRYFRPYARAMTEAVADRLAATGRAVVIDLHSYPTAPLPYELHGSDPRPAICLGTDTLHTPPALLSAAREAFAGCEEIGLDSPFIGTYVPLEFYGKEPAVGALMVEIRRDTYMTEPGGPPDGPGIARLASALATLVNAVSP